MRPVERLPMESRGTLSLYEPVDPWPIHWSGIWGGALAGLAIALIFGLIGIAVGANHVGQTGQVTRLAEMDRATMIFSIFGSFIAFWVAGWAAAKIAGVRHLESAMLHGVIAWLVAV